MKKFTEEPDVTKEDIDSIDKMRDDLIKAISGQRQCCKCKQFFEPTSSGYVCPKCYSKIKKFVKQIMGPPPEPHEDY